MTQIKLRRDTSANFTSKNPVLGIGEPAYETDTKKLKIGDGTTAYTQLAYFSSGGGSSDITATLPIKIVDGVISLEVDGQTIQIVDGKLHANLDELGNEVNDLSGRLTSAEADILTKQDKLTAGDNITISENNVISATGGSAPANMVTTDTAQTITGAKTFGAKIYTPNIILADEFTKSRITSTRSDGFSLLQISRPDNTNEYFEVGRNHRMKTCYIKPCDGDTALVINNYGDGDITTVPTSNVKIYGNVVDGSNNKFLTSGDKETIMGYIMPDYSTRTAVPWGTDNTAPTDGYVEVFGEGDGNTAAYVLEYTLNGVKTAVSSCHATATNTNFRLSVICPKGTVYSARGGANGHELHFISMKGAV